MGRVHPSVVPGSAGVTQIFAHGITSLQNLPGFAGTPTGVRRYVERALVMARPGDLVCVVDAVEEEYLRFLATLGIGPRREHVIVAGAGRCPSGAVTLPELLMRSPEALRALRAGIPR